MSDEEPVYAGCEGPASMYQANIMFFRMYFTYNILRKEFPIESEIALDLLMAADFLKKVFFFIN